MGLIEGAAQGLAVPTTKLRHAIIWLRNVAYQKRRYHRRPATSGLPRETDIARPVRLVRLVPK